MANISITDYEARKSAPKTFKERAKIGYFSYLKDDGDEAIVRFDYDTRSDFEVSTVHRVKVGDNWRNVACIKEVGQPKEKCPLCAAEVPMKSKIFVKLIAYVKNEQGVLEVQPNVWERPTDFVADLDEAIKDAVEDEIISNNTPIRDIVFKVRRVGEKGNLKTKYKLKVGKPSIFPESTFVKDFSAFEGFSPAHHSYMVRTEEEIKEFLETGAFPVREKPAQTTPATETATAETKPVLDLPDDLEVFGGTAASPVAEQPVKEEPTTQNKPKRWEF